MRRPMPCGGTIGSVGGNNAEAPNAASPFRDSRRVIAIRARRVYYLAALKGPPYVHNVAKYLRGAMRAALVAASIVLLPVAAATRAARMANGEAVYRQHCAGCQIGRAHV